MGYQRKAEEVEKGWEKPGKLEKTAEIRICKTGIGKRKMNCAEGKEIIRKTELGKMTKRGRAEGRINGNLCKDEGTSWTVEGHTKERRTIEEEIMRRNEGIGEEGKSERGDKEEVKYEEERYECAEENGKTG